jgi:hypothetical protein
MQSLKHEEILLELESIRARRERLMPICPNCSTQTYPIYQPLNITSSHSHQQSRHTSTHNSPTRLANQYQHLSQIQQQQQQQQPYYNHHQSLLQAVQQLQNPLLSINIPQGAASISPSFLSPQFLASLPLSQLSTAHHLACHSPFPVFTIPGKQFVTVDCQTSPTNGASDQYQHNDHHHYNQQHSSYRSSSSSISPRRRQADQHTNANLLIEAKPLKVNAYAQTILSDVFKRTESKGVNTDNDSYYGYHDSINRYGYNKNAPMTKRTESKSINTEPVYIDSTRLNKRFESKTVNTEPESPRKILIKQTETKGCNTEPPLTVTAASSQPIENKLNQSNLSASTILSALNSVASVANSIQQQQQQQHQQQQTQPKFTFTTASQTMPKQTKNQFVNCNIYEEENILPSNVTIPTPPKKECFDKVKFI